MNKYLPDALAHFRHVCSIRETLSRSPLTCCSMALPPRGLQHQNRRRAFFANGKHDLFRDHRQGIVDAATIIRTIRSVVHASTHERILLLDKHGILQYWQYREEQAIGVEDVRRNATLACEKPWHLWSTWWGNRLMNHEDMGRYRGWSLEYKT